MEVIWSSVNGKIIGNNCVSFVVVQGVSFFFFFFRDTKVEVYSWRSTQRQRKPLPVSVADGRRIHAYSCKVGRRMFVRDLSD